MESGIYNLLYSFLDAVTIDGAFLICGGFIAVGFLINFVLSLSIRGYGKLKRIWFVFLSLAANCIFAALSVIKNCVELSLLLAGITLIFFAVALCLPKRKLKVLNEHRELARFIDGATQKRSFEQHAPFASETKNSFMKTAQQRYVEPMADKKEYELDFEHVKSVLSRLEYFNLSPSDKRQVGELERSISVAERNGADQETKSIINDGLGALLKIMSKYGV